MADDKVNWELYEAPHIWAMVADEAGPPADNMVNQFYRTSQYVDDTRARLVAAAQRLARAWSGLAAADGAQAQITEITESLSQDSEAYATSTRELDSVVNRLGQAKQSIKVIYDKWLALQQLPRQLGTLGIGAAAVTGTTEYQKAVQETNADARNEMRKLDRDLSTARITPAEEFLPTVPPTQNDMQLAGINPQHVAMAHGRGGGVAGVDSQLAGAPLVTPAAGAPAGVRASSGGVAAPRAPVSGVIGAGESHRPATGMMGGGMGAHGGAGGAGGASGGKASEQWETRRGVKPVIEGTQAPDPSTMGVDDSFDRKDR